LVVQDVTPQVQASAKVKAEVTAGQDGHPRRWLMLPVILIAMFMAGFDIWAVNVAAPSLQRDLHVSEAALQLIVGGYAFMYASGMVTGGERADRRARGDRGHSRAWGCHRCTPGS
jgi:MFS family permease